MDDDGGPPPPLPHLTAMPVPVLNIITKHFDLKTVLNFRKVCRCLRFYTESASFNFNHQEVTIKEENVGPDAITVSVLSREKLCSSETITYRKDGEDCLVKCDNRTKRVKNVNFARMAANDLGLLLKHQTKCLDKLEIMVKKRLPKKECDPDSNTARFLTNFENHLNSRRILLKTKKFIMKETHKEELIMSVLSYLDPIHLEDIELTLNIMPHLSSHVAFKMDAILESPQWEQAKRISMNGLIVNVPLENFQHFEQADFLVKKCSIEELIEIKKKMHRLPHNSKMSIRFKYGTFKGASKVVEAFRGQPRLTRLNSKMWKYKIRRRNLNERPSRERHLIIWDRKARRFSFLSHSSTEAFLP